MHKIILRWSVIAVFFFLTASCHTSTRSADSTDTSAAPNKITAVPMRSTSNLNKDFLETLKKEADAKVIDRRFQDVLKQLTAITKFDEEKIKELINLYLDLEPLKTTDAPNISQIKNWQIQIAALLSLKKKFGSRPSTSTFTKEEQADFDRIVAFYDNFISLFQNLIRSLSQNEIEALTQDNPDSLFRKIGRASLMESTGVDCTATEYAELKKKYDPVTLAKQGIWLFFLAENYEKPFYPQYFARLIDIVKTRNDESLELLEFLPLFAKQNTGDRWAELTQAQIERSEARLVEKGIPQEELRDKATDLALIAPGCVGAGVLNLDEPIRRDLTLIKGERLLAKLHDYFTAQGKISLPVTENFGTDPVYGDYITDAWSNDFRISSENGKIQLRSLGADEKSESDDLIIGD